MQETVTVMRPPARMGANRSAVTSRALPVRTPQTPVESSGSGGKWLDPEVLGTHLGRLLRAAWTLCGSRENAEDLVQETMTRILSRPRFLRGQDELAYLMQALRNTYLTSKRTAGRRPRMVAMPEELNVADHRNTAGPEEAVLAAQVFPAIAQLPEAYRLALVAVDIAGLSYREAARALGAPEATITTRLHRARRRVARELDPERFAAGQPKAIGTRALDRPVAPPPRVRLGVCVSTAASPPRTRASHEETRARHGDLALNGRTRRAVVTTPDGSACGST